MIESNYSVLLQAGYGQCVYRVKVNPFFLEPSVGSQAGDTFVKEVAHSISLT